MATVVIPAILRDLCGGAPSLEVEGATLDALLVELDRRCPGFYGRVVEDGRLRPELAFALDGEVVRLGLHDVVQPAAEITIVPAIGGG